MTTICTATTSPLSVFHDISHAAAPWLSGRYLQLNDTTMGNVSSCTLAGQGRNLQIFDAPPSLPLGRLDETSRQALACNTLFQVLSDLGTWLYTLAPAGPE